MLSKEFLLEDDYELLGNNIKNFFEKGGHYVIIKNYKILSNDEIINCYNKLNKQIGRLIPIDLVKNTYESSGNYWADVKYDYDSDEKQFWRSSNHQNLHTDNTFCGKEFYGNLTELVCFKKAEYSGNTVLISNNKIIELIKFVDKNIKSNLFNSILNKEIYHSAGDSFLKRKILEYNKDLDQYIFCYNYFPASRGNNNEADMNIIKNLNNFLEEKIMLSNLMDEVNLNRGDALIFNDELVMHGRKSFIGTRHYIKTGIQLDSASIYDYNI